MVSYNNFAEVRAFVVIANALMAGHPPDIDENPYLRQLKQKGASTTYIKDKANLPWDKNVNPWVYYNEFVPVGVRKKVELKAKIYTIVTVGLLGSLILVAMYTVAQQIIH